MAIWARADARDHQHRHFRPANQVEERIAAFNLVKTAADEADGGMSRSHGPRDGKLRGQPVAG